ncbi:MAG: hypothetical protein AAFO76_10450 [Cyanobacteria bacterium J06607_15]
MKNVTLTFVGFKSEEMAQKFFSWIVDGGLEDGIIDTLSDDSVQVEGLVDFNTESLDIAVLSKEKAE